MGERNGRDRALGFDDGLETGMIDFLGGDDPGKERKKRGAVTLNEWWILVGRQHVGRYFAL
ncbi:hypothetical protein BOTNAR_0304g00010 [Botryotinia narcissicola]|uniref:Uncharacterized protein n=1 Tax=Botryotinia narcissicola TaxID=278944 RepID=A0A4Z1I913_9HELO|nr:hypothetical protein BOTNAR_0304g00010 [Botryotinia narcissicola]